MRPCVPGSELRASPSEGYQQAGGLVIFRIDLPFLELPPGIWAWRIVKEKLVSLPQYLVGMGMFLGLAYLLAEVM